MKPRLTIVEHVYYEADGAAKEFGHVPYSRVLESDEQPYQRVITVNEEWQLLDLGWVAGNCGMLIVHNQAVRRTTYPTKEETETEDASIVELAIAVPSSFAEVLVGDDCRLTPTVPLFIRCQRGTAKVIITALPK